MKAPTRSVILTSLILATCGTSAKASDLDGEYSFTIEPSERRVRRHRRAQDLNHLHHVPSMEEDSFKEVDDAIPNLPGLGISDAETTGEDQEFWDRILDEHLSMPSTMAPTACPTRVEIDCVVVGTGIPCSEVEPVPGNTGDDCIVEVEFTYTITNTGAAVEQIYTLVVQRADETIIVTDIPEAIPTTLLVPGQSVNGTGVYELNICGDLGLSVFNTKADVLTGPPSSVQVTIACVSDEGVECKQISEETDPVLDECLLDVTYTYTVENIGQSDFNIILFTRTRNGEFLDLMPLLDSLFLEVGGSTAVQETEQIDRCMAQTFATRTVVVKIPPAELLCEDTGFYLVEMGRRG